MKVGTTDVRQAGERARARITGEPQGPGWLGALGIGIVAGATGAVVAFLADPQRGKARRSGPSRPAGQLAPALTRAACGENARAELAPSQRRLPSLSEESESDRGGDARRCELPSWARKNRC